MARIYKLAKLADEQGTYWITCSFKKDNVLIDAAVISSVVWWLTDLSGNVINGREEVSVSSITNPSIFVFYGDDLQIVDESASVEGRIFTVRGLFSSSLGVALPFTRSVAFDVQNLLVVETV